MLAAAGQKHHKDHVYKKNSLDLLKTAALYGANGAGKSNLVKAINLLQKIVIMGGRETLSEIKKYKLDRNYQELPSTFEIEFIKNDIVYLFGIEVQKNEISEEWLYKSGLNKIPDEIIFHRKGTEKNTEIRFSKDYYRTEKDKFNLEFVQDNLVKKNELLFEILSELKEGFENVKDAYDWFINDLIIIFPHTKPGTFVLEVFLKSNSLKNFTNTSLSSFNTGVYSIDVRSFSFEEYLGSSNGDLQDTIRERLQRQPMFSLSIEDGSDGIVAMKENGIPVFKRFTSIHKDLEGKLVEFILKEESDGTNRLIHFVPLLFGFLNSEIVILIDEIDQSIHPVLLKELVAKTVSDKESKGQFIFTTHEANLLDQSIFRRDEIWFVEKDQGETKLYPLSDFDIRYDLDIRKGYLNGRFGAIPFMGDLQNLNWDQYAEAE